VDEAVALYESGRTQEAEDRLSALVGEVSGRELARCHYVLGLIAESRLGAPVDDDFDEVEEAMIHYREALRIEPSNFDARLRLSMLCARSGFFEDAVREMEEAVRTAPHNGHVRAKAAELYYVLSAAKEVKVGHPTGLGATTDFKGAKRYIELARAEVEAALGCTPSLMDQEEFAALRERIEATYRRLLKGG